MTTIIDHVRRHVGRRHRISPAEMTALVQSLVDEAGVDPRNGHYMATLDRSDAAGRRPAELPPAPDAAAAWTRACLQGSVISVMGPGSRDVQGDGQIRFDQPGSMHPMQRANVTFVARSALWDGTAEYLRARARRVLIVEE